MRKIKKELLKDKADCEDPFIKQHKIELVKKPASKLNVFYCALMIMLYGGFWFGYYLLNTEWALGLGIGVVVLMLVVYAILHEKPAVVIAFGLCTGVGLGLCISAYFIQTHIIPSRFFGLILLCFLGVKCFQSYVCSIIKYKKTYLAIFALIELAAVIIFISVRDFHLAARSQILFAFSISMFLSLGQIGFFSRRYEDNSWKNAAMGLIIGYVIIVLIIISLLFEDGSFFEALGSGGDISIGNGKKTKHRTLEEIGNITTWAGAAYLENTVEYEPENKKETKPLDDGEML